MEKLAFFNSNYKLQAVIVAMYRLIKRIKKSDQWVGKMYIIM